MLYATWSSSVMETHERLICATAGIRLSGGRRRYGHPWLGSTFLTSHTVRPRRSACARARIASISTASSATSDGQTGEHRNPAAISAARGPISQALYLPLFHRRKVAGRERPAGSRARRTSGTPGTGGLARRAAIERGEASLLIRTLVELLARVNRVSPLPVGVVEEIFELIRLRLKAPREAFHQSAATSSRR